MKKTALVISGLLFMAQGDLSSAGTSLERNAPVQLYDEGVRKGRTYAIDCQGDGIACWRDGGFAFISVTGGSSGGSDAGVSISFAQNVNLTSAGYFAQLVSLSSVTATSRFVCRPFGTTDAGLTPQVIAISGIQATAYDLDAGAGLTLGVWNPNGLEGSVTINCTGG